MHVAMQKSICLASGYNDAVPSTGNHLPAAPPMLAVFADKPSFKVGALTELENLRPPKMPLKNLDAGDVPCVAPPGFVLVDKTFAPEAAAPIFKAISPSKTC